MFAEPLFTCAREKVGRASRRRVWIRSGRLGALSAFECGRSDLWNYRTLFQPQRYKNHSCCKVNVDFRQANFSTIDLVSFD